MKLEFNRCPGETTRLTFYSKFMTWSLGFFRKPERKYWGWRPDSSGITGNGVLWMRYGSLFIWWHERKQTTDG